MEIIYIEAVLMENGEVIHMGKTLGYENGDKTKLSKPDLPVITLK